MSAHVEPLPLPRRRIRHALAVGQAIVEMPATRGPGAERRHSKHAEPLRRLLPFPTVGVEHDDLLCAREKADVAVGPFVPPSSDLLWVRRRTFRPVDGARMLPRRRARGALAAGAHAVLAR